MKKNRIVISILIILILSIGGIWIGKTVYDRHVEEEKAFMLAEEQRLEEERKAAYIRKLDYLDVYAKSPNEKEGLWATREVNGIYVYEDYLKVWLRLYQLNWPSKEPLTLEEFYDLYLEADSVVEEKVDRLFDYYAMEGVHNQRKYLEEMGNAWLAYKEANGEAINGKEQEDLTYEDYVALEEWAIAHPDEEKYEHLLFWYADREKRDIEWNEMKNAYDAYEETYNEPFNDKEWRELTYDDWEDLEEWAVAHPDEELYPNILKWHREKAEEERKAAYIRKLDYLDVYARSPNEKEGLWATREVNGIYVYEDYLKVWLRLYQLTSPMIEPLTLEEFYDLYLEADSVVEKKVDRFFGNR